MLDIFKGSTAARKKCFGFAPTSQYRTAPLDVVGVVALLWRDSKVPEWINIKADSADLVSVGL